MHYRLDPAVLDRARHIDGLTSDEQLGAAIGKTGQTIRAWRAGTTCPNIAGLAALQRITGMGFDKMVIDTDTAVSA